VSQDTIGSRSRRAHLALCACAIFAFTGLFRFNLLGGSFGGFENDHFIPFAYAKQVQAGEQPLRDFTGLGLQGVWPSLTYEISAAGQRLLGNNLRSEALVTIAGIALASAATCVAAAQVAPLGWAVLVTVLGILLQPTLYNYPKVLVLSVAAVAICTHARWRSHRTAAALALVTVIAFLFRHDYAVYVAAGAVVVLASAAARVRTAAQHGLVYGVTALVLVTPSLLFVQRHRGLLHYWNDSVVATGVEANRTYLEWPRFTAIDSDGSPVGAAGMLSIVGNAEAWLYYLALALPAAVLLVCWRTDARRRWSSVSPAILALAVMLLLADWLLLRGNLLARFGDVSPLLCVMLAVLASRATASWMDERRWQLHVRRVAVAVLLAGTFASVATAEEVMSQLKAAGLLVSPAAIAHEASENWAELADLPRAYWSADDVTGTVYVAQYVNRCTAAGDRVIALGYVPEIAALADRRFAGGRLNYVRGLLTDEEHQREILDHWTPELVPIVLVMDKRRVDPELRLVERYLHEHYILAGTIPADAELGLQTFVRRDAVPTSTFGKEGLPCFR
jgi:hypothetical protein